MALYIHHSGVKYNNFSKLILSQQTEKQEESETAETDLQEMGLRTGAAENLAGNGFSDRSEVNEYRNFLSRYPPGLHHG
jgi:hypothetical protein